MSKKCCTFAASLNKLSINTNINKQKIFIMENKKDKTIAIILTLCLGVYGGHWFYLGDQKRAWWYLGLGLGGLLLCAGLPTIVIWVLAIIDLVKLIQMPDAEFNEKYNGEAKAE